MTKRRIVNGMVFVWTRRGWRQVLNGHIRTRKGWRLMRRTKGRRATAAPVTEEAAVANQVRSGSSLSPQLNQHEEQRGEGEGEGEMEVGIRVHWSASSRVTDHSRDNVFYRPRIGGTEAF
jgi:hypothetical protein